MELRVGGKYRIGKKLGEGAFGLTCSGTNIKSNEEVAIKLETLQSRMPQLQYESKIYKIFHGEVGFAQSYFFGVEGDYNVLVMDILGPSLQKLFTYCDKVFTLKTICMIAIQCIDRIEKLHEKGFLHRDIKPENFLIGVQKKSQIVYIIDFGLAKRYIDPKTGAHTVYKENKGMTGTVRYASLNAHIGHEQSRRDDLEAIGYMLVYFYRKGELPWKGVKVKNRKERAETLINIKRETTFETLLHGAPSEFIEYMHYCRNLGFEQRPDYTHLKHLFESVMQKHGWENDLEFDWIIKKMQQSIAKCSSAGTLEENKQPSSTQVRPSLKIPTLMLTNLSRGWDTREKLSESSDSEFKDGAFESARLSKRDKIEHEREELARRRKERLIEMLDKEDKTSKRATSIGFGMTKLESFKRTERAKQLIADDDHHDKEELPSLDAKGKPKKRPFRGSSQAEINTTLPQIKKVPPQQKLSSGGASSTLITSGAGQPLKQQAPLKGVLKNK